MAEILCAHLHIMLLSHFEVFEKYRGLKVKNLLHDAKVNFETFFNVLVTMHPNKFHKFILA